MAHVSQNSLGSAWPALIVASTPWLKGVLGWAGATLLWDVLVKPGQEQRSLARALGAEVGFNLQLVAAHRQLLDKAPRSISGDFALSTMVFSALTPRLGQLRSVLVADLVKLYNQITALNRLVEFWSQTIDQYNDTEVTQIAVRSRLQTHLNSILGVFRSSLEETANHANTVLPKLRARERLWFLRWRKGPTIPLDEIDSRVTALYAQRLLERQGPPPPTSSGSQPTTPALSRDPGPIDAP